MDATEPLLIAGAIGCALLATCFIVIAAVKDKRRAAIDHAKNKKERIK